MEWLNYHHLLYFWVVAREGSIVRASEEPVVQTEIYFVEFLFAE